MLTVDLNKDTKTIINMVLTGSNPDLSQEQPTENQCQCLCVRTYPCCFFNSVTAVLIEVCHTLHDKT
jgi:hypothetical protein